jgi:hypothetical protein
LNVAQLLITLPTTLFSPTMMQPLDESWSVPLWIKMPLKLEKGKVRLRLHKSEVGSTYRNVDTAIVTDDLLA